MRFETFRDIRDENQALGVLYIVDGCDVVFKCDTIERGWMNNEKMISCIPAGEYEIVLEYSPKFDTMLWEIKGVENRAEAKIHSANYARQLNGCIGVGNGRKDIDNDGYFDVLNSKKTLKALHEIMGGEIKTTIKISEI